VRCGENPSKSNSAAPASAATRFNFVPAEAATKLADETGNRTFMHVIIIPHFEDLIIAMR
jgi:hypothetical protein